MKKILSLILLFCLILTCVGCDSDEKSDPVEDEETIDTSNENSDSSTQNEELAKYFDPEIVTALTEFSGISDFSLSTSLLDEDCDQKPIAVLFFTVDSLDENDAEDDYYKKVNNGGCIEIFEDATDAKGRNNYLTGYFLFGLTGGKHAAVDKYVVQASEKLTNKDQKNIVNELTSILNASEEGSSESVQGDKHDQQTDGSTKTENTAGAPDSWTNLLEKHYEEVKKQFEDAGFTNIICVAHEIDYNENNVFEGSVVNIAIGENGEICTFEKDEQWDKDIKIRIDYRVKPVGEEKTDDSVTTPGSSTDSNPYNKVEDYSVHTKSEYAHIDSAVIRLGNGERVWITIKASPATLSMNDFVVDYDDAMLEIIDVRSSTVGDILQIELTVKAKSSGVSEIIICSGYELYEDAENIKGYVLTVRGLDSTDGKVVYITSTGEKYHFSESCVASGIKTTLNDALAYEYGPCSKCAK